MSGSDDHVASRSQVVIGMDPHKRSVTIEVMTGVEEIVGGGRFGTDGAGFVDLLRCAQEWPERVWAVEGCNGIGRHVATRLVEAGERVIDVPPKLSARVRIFATGQGRKTDATNAHSIALVGVRMSGLAPVVRDEQREVLRLLVDRRRRIGEEHTVKTCQLHSLLLGLVPRRPGPCWRRCAHVTWSARPDDGSPLSWSRTSSGSMRARRTRTRSFGRSSTTTSAPACSTCTASDPPAQPGCWSR